MRNSDTPIQPLPKMQFVDTLMISGKSHTYSVLSVNTKGLKSKPSSKVKMTK